MTRFRTLFDVGEPYKLWPFSDGKELIVALATGRSDLANNGTYHRYKGEVVTGNHSVRRRCELYRIWDDQITLVADFYSENANASNTGQPFITKSGHYLVPVWNVDYYCYGRSYGAIYLSRDKGHSWQCVYEDYDATYLNHFYQDETGAIYLGCGWKGGGRDGQYSYTPNKGFLLRSTDDGGTWERMLEFDKPGALYSAVSFRERLVVSTREDRSILIVANGSTQRVLVDEQTRNISVIGGKLVIASDNCFLFTDDLKNWSRYVFDSDHYMVLRYPAEAHGMIMFGAVSRYPKSYLLFTDWEKSYYWDFAKCCEGYFARIAMQGGILYAGTEFDGKLVAITLNDIELSKIQRPLLSRLKQKTKAALRPFIGR